MRLLICGDRDWNDQALIGKVIDSLKIRPSVIIEGGARGADKQAKFCAINRNIPFMEFKAQWNKYGKSAGPIRNQQMIEEGKPTDVIAFHDDIDNSKGTKHMVSLSRKAGIPTVVVSHCKAQKEEYNQ